jgi:hypothetical protein
MYVYDREGAMYGFFLAPKVFFSGPTQFEGKSEPVMHEGSGLGYLTYLKTAFDLVFFFFFFENFPETFFQ